MVLPQLQIFLEEERASHIAVTDSNCQGIGGVVWLWNFLKIQEIFGHLHHLFFLRHPVTHHRHLHLHGGIFVNRQLVLLAAEEDNPPGLGHSHHGGLIVGGKELLDSHSLRAVLFQSDGKLVIDGQEALAHLHPRRGSDGPIIHHPVFPPLAVHHAAAHNGISRIDA